MALIHYLFFGYSLLIFARIMSSWIPQLAGSSIMRPVYALTEPYLAIFRRLIPPIGGTVDISPIIALLALSFAERLIIRLFI